MLQYKNPSIQFEDERVTFRGTTSVRHALRRWRAQRPDYYQGSAVTGEAVPVYTGACNMGHFFGIQTGRLSTGASLH
jgi:hypothetical protein